MGFIWRGWHDHGSPGLLIESARRFGDDFVFVKPSGTKKGFEFQTLLNCEPLPGTHYPPASFSYFKMFEAWAAIHFPKVVNTTAIQSEVLTKFVNTPAFFHCVLTKEIKLVRAGLGRHGSRPGTGWL